MVPLPVLAGALLRVVMAFSWIAWGQKTGLLGPVLVISGRWSPAFGVEVFHRLLASAGAGVAGSAFAWLCHCIALPPRIGLPGDSRCRHSGTAIAPVAPAWPSRACVAGFWVCGVCCAAAGAGPSMSAGKTSDNPRPASGPISRRCPAATLVVMFFLPSFAASRPGFMLPSTQLPSVFPVYCGT